MRFFYRKYSVSLLLLSILNCDRVRRTVAKSSIDDKFIKFQEKKRVRVIVIIIIMIEYKERKRKKKFDLLPCLKIQRRSKKNY